MTLVFLTSLIPLLDEGIFTAPLGYDIRHDETSRMETKAKNSGRV